MAISNAQNGTRTDGSGNQPNQPISPKTPRTKRTRTPKPAEPLPQNSVKETEVILDEAVSDVARENVDIRLKSADVPSLPDENAALAGAAAMLVLLLDGVGMMAFGDFARLTPMEHTMIEEPLKRILAKASPNTLAMIGKYSDPVLLVMGMLAWMSRVTSEAKRRKEPATPPKTEPEPKVVTATPPGSVNDIVTNPPPEIIGNFDTIGLPL